MLLPAIFVGQYGWWKPGVLGKWSERLLKLLAAASSEKLRIYFGAVCADGLMSTTNMEKVHPPCRGSALFHSGFKIRKLRKRMQGLEMDEVLRISRLRAYGYLKRRKSNRVVENTALADIMENNLPGTQRKRWRRSYARGDNTSRIHFASPQPTNHSD